MIKTRLNIFIIFSLLFLLFNRINTQPNQNQQFVQNQHYQDNQIYLQNQHPQQIMNMNQGQLSQWVRQQYKNTNEEDQSLDYGQYFIIKLQPKQVQQFRWPLKNINKQYKIQFVIYNTQNGDDFTYVKDPAQDQYVFVEYKQKWNDDYQSFGTVYVKKQFKIQARDGIFVRITNFHNIQVLVQIGLQGDPIVINPNIVTKDDHFSIQAQKISAIHQQSKKSQANRYRYYKTQWGFHQRQEHYESQMLTLTGIELFIILATSIVQMCCIKGLLDNRPVI